MTVSFKYNHAVVSVILHPDLASNKTQKYFLAVARHKTDENAKDRYGLPGGKVESGESHSLAASRETMEETGCIILVPQNPIFSQYCPGKVCYMSHAFYPESVIFPENFSFKINEPFPGPEGTNLCWLTSEELIYNSPFGYYNQCLFKTLNLL